MTFYFSFWLWFVLQRALMTQKLINSRPGCVFNTISIVKLIDWHRNKNAERFLSGSAPAWRQDLSVVFSNCVIALYWYTQYSEKVPNSALSLKKAPTGASQSKNLSRQCYNIFIDRQAFISRINICHQDAWLQKTLICGQVYFDVTIEEVYLSASFWCLDV